MLERKHDSRGFAAIDFETYWRSRDYSLSKMGPVEYIRDERFRPQLMGVCLHKDGKDATGVCEEETMPSMLRLLRDTPLVGHNMHGFDALILSEHFNIHPHEVWDTICMARWVGVSRLCGESHAALTAFLGTGVKEAGTAISDGKRWPDEFTSTERVAFAKYCLDDTVQCSINARMLMPYVSSDALRFMSITARMATEPAFVIDGELLEKYIVELDAQAEKARKDIMELFAFQTVGDMLSSVRSSAKFASMLRDLGVEPPMKISDARTATKRKKLEALAARAREEGSLDLASQLEKARDNMPPELTYAFSRQDLPFLDLLDHADPRVRLLVRTRLDHNSSVVRSRAERLLKFAGRPVPVMLSAFKAHTSRYTAGASDVGSSDRLQFQNLSKHNPAHKPLRQAIRAPEGYCVVAGDSSQVEARCLAWAAEEIALVEQFRQGRDPYSELAEVVYNVPADEVHAGAKAGDRRLKTYRDVCKRAILSCLAGDTLVLTDTRGWIPLVEVTTDDRVFDGTRWVRHEGVICQGEKRTIMLGDLELTEDHKIFLGGTGSKRMPARYFMENCEGGRSRLITAQRLAVAAIRKFDPTIPTPPRLRSDRKFDHFHKTQHVYDILNAGPNHCFMVRKGDMVLLVSNCGYGVGAAKYSDTLLRAGTRLAEHDDDHFEAARRVHSIYRANNPHIVTFWKTCDQVLHALVRGEHGAFGGPDGLLFRYGIIPVGGTGVSVPSIALPSGFILRYPELRAELNDKGKVEFNYTQQVGKNSVVKKTYGGAITENCIQSLAFQILMWQACRMDEDGLSLKANIHDSFATVVPIGEAEDAREKMRKWLTTPPPWAATLPLDCNVETGYDFTVV